MSNPNLTYFDEVTRLEIINHSDCDKCDGKGTIHIEGQFAHFECPACHGEGLTGREVLFNDPYKKVEAILQDDGRTLKFLITERVS